MTSGYTGRSPVATADEVPPEHLVPGWLVVLVAVLLIVVLGVGAVVVLRLGSEPQTLSLEQQRIDTLLAEVRADPADLSARLQLGYAYQVAGRYDEAIAEYETVLESAPDDMAALYNRGLALFEQGRTADAEESLKRVLEVDPTHALAAKALGEHYVEIGRHSSVLEVVAAAADANEGSADLQYLMGVAHENLGDAELAEAYYRLALRYVPDMTGARDGLDRLGVR